MTTDFDPTQDIRSVVYHLCIAIQQMQKDLKEMGEHLESINKNLDECKSISVTNLKNYIDERIKEYIEKKN